ncbi:hypothetical protein [Pseudaminobacter soli (ex Li et al. 2025)]|uniref:Uncharacterized protein n=1 Tax=Pseudaminobacter soli (ex Li et al. 2025) TaxID=1295366 RepID=A0A2P7S044_9HYPH|nr:hypothetical protein [Mesorhizobium soli]PSJ55806.1 hypothetical protein C7I85_26330 [Mesorhizobium soli]
MSTGFEFFERDLRVATAGMEPDAINRAVADFARKELQRVIAEGVASPKFDRFVNGVRGAPEEAYQAPGAIIYEFTNWPLVINAALDELRKRSPRKSGRFASSFIVISGGRLVTDYSAIPADAEVIITNAQPYVRRLEGGKKKGQKRIFDGSKSALGRRFSGVFRFETRFLDIAGGVHPLIPYILKGSHGRREGRQAGQPITYPAIVINGAS